MTNGSGLKEKKQFQFKNVVHVDSCRKLFHFPRKGKFLNRLFNYKKLKFYKIQMTRSKLFQNLQYVANFEQLYLFVYTIKLNNFKTFLLSSVPYPCKVPCHRDCNPHDFRKSILFFAGIFLAVGFFLSGIFSWLKDALARRST